MRSYDSVAYKDDARGGCRQARQGRPRGRRLRGCRGQRRDAYHGGILPVRISRMRRWSLRPRRARIVKANARSGVASSRRRPHATSSPSVSACRSTTSPCTSRLLGGGFGRKSKPDYGVEAAVLSKAIGRQAGQGRVDARRRSAQRLFPYRLRRASRSGRRRAGTTGRVAASHRGADDRVHVRCRAPGRKRTGNSAWVSSTSPLPFPTFASRTRKRSRIRASAGSAPYRIFRMRSPCSRSSPSSPRRRAATRRTSCSR